MTKQRVYILLETINGKSSEAVSILRNKAGVIRTDILEGPPDVLVICEAQNRQRLVDITGYVLAAVEQVTENVNLLPVRN